MKNKEIRRLVYYIVFSAIMLLILVTISKEDHSIWFYLASSMCIGGNIFWYFLFQDCRNI